MSGKGGRWGVGGQAAGRMTGDASASLVKSWGTWSKYVVSPMHVYLSRITRGINARDTYQSPY